VGETCPNQAMAVCSKGILPKKLGALMRGNVSGAQYPLITNGRYMKVSPVGGKGWPETTGGPETISASRPSRAVSPKMNPLFL